MGSQQQGMNHDTPVSNILAHQEQTTWLLKLPPDLERQFFQDRSVRGVYTLFDMLALTQALLLNWHLVRKLGGWKQASSVMQPHELATAVLFFTAALLQMAFMLLRPKLYAAHRQRIALANRCARLLALVVTAVLSTPAVTQQKVGVFLTRRMCSAGDVPDCTSASAGVHADIRMQHSPCTEASADCADLAAIFGVGALLKAVVLEPAIIMMHANWLLPFWVAVPMQLCTCLISAWKTLRSHVCSGIFFTDTSALAAMQPACQKLNWMLYTVFQLLDVEIPQNPSDISVESDTLCSQPLALLIVFHLWVRVVLLVVVPCVLIYCLEGHLKAVFLSRFSRRAVQTAEQPAWMRRGAHGTVPLAQNASSGLQDASSLSLNHSSSIGISTTSNGLQGVSFLSRDVQRINGTRRAGASASSVLTHQAQDLRPHASRTANAQLQEAGLQRLQQRQQALHQALQAVQPAPVSELLLPGSGLQFVRWCVVTGLALCVVTMCWHLCEVGVLMLPWRGREFVCDEQGWLHVL